MMEIQCPESCVHLQEGRARESEQEYQRYLRAADAATRQRYFRVLPRFGEIISHLEVVIAGERRAMRDLADGELVEALDLLLATLRTEESGVLYERTANNLRVEGLRRLLSTTIGYYRHPKDATVERLLLADAIDCLETVRSIAAYHVQAGTALKGYVHFLARNMPRAPGAESSGARIIIPGN